MFSIPPFSSSSSSSSLMDIAAAAALSRLDPIVQTAARKAPSRLDLIIKAAAQAAPPRLDPIVQAAARAALNPNVPMGQKSSKRKTPPNDDASAPPPSKRARPQEAERLFNQAMKLVKSHDAQAIQLLEKALDLGYIRAQKHLAFACVREQRFSDLAKYSLMIVSRRESASSLHNLAMLHHEGNGVDQDDSIAWSYAERAAAKKHPSSLVWMARRYEKGAIIKNKEGQVIKVIPKDLKKAKELYEGAAKQGHSFAQECVARMNSMPESD